MDVEAGDVVHHRLAGGVDRRVLRELGEERREALCALGGDQDGAGLMPPAAGQRAQHHLALGDEPAEAPSDIAVADIAERLDARVGRVVDEGDGG